MAYSSCALLTVLVLLLVSSYADASSPNKISWSFYGDGGNGNSVPMCSVIQSTTDVTSQMQTIWSSNPAGTLITITTSLFGISDPAPNIHKYLVIFYTDVDPPDVVSEGSTWEIRALLSPKPSFPCVVWAGVMEAWFGLPPSQSPTFQQQWKNVTGEMQDLMKYATGFLPSAPYFAARGVPDPAPGVVKTLLVRWSDCLPQGRGSSGPIIELETFVFPHGIWNLA